MSSRTNDHAVVETLRRAMWMVLVISLGGVTFSGMLSVRELTGGPASCTIGGVPAAIFGIPACVYGLVMYSALAGISTWALARTRSQVGGFARASHGE